MQQFNIKIATTESEFEEARSLFEEYAQSLNFDLSYQDFKEELDHLPGQYAAPDGALLLSYVNVDAEASSAEESTVVAAGCAGIRKFQDDIAELKRLYVQPEYRKLKIGKSLLEAAIETAARLQYKRIRLDTVPGQTKAQDLYRLLGFYEIEAYRFSPIEGTIYFEKLLP